MQSVETVDPVGDVTDFHSQQYAADTLKGESVVYQPPHTH